MTIQSDVRQGEFVNWRKSSFSNPNGNECVELASTGRVVGVRDSKNRDGGALMFGALIWKQFTDQMM